MAGHYDEEAQVAALKKWWQENWIALAAGLVIGLGAIFGWQSWQQHKVNEAAAASRIFEDMNKAHLAKQNEQVAELGETLLKQYGSTPYAAAAALKLAAVAVEANQLDMAVSRLSWVVQHSSDAGLKSLAQLRQARVLWAQEKADEALKLLNSDAGVYGALYEELRGDIQLAKGDRPAAQQAYRKALDTAAEDDRAIRESLRRKLDDLADVADVAQS